MRCFQMCEAVRVCQVWDLASGRVLATLGRHVSHTVICTGGDEDDEELQFQRSWNDINISRAVVALEEIAASMRACAVMPDGEHVILMSNDGALEVWNLAGHIVATLTVIPTECAHAR